jgi:hypothetical protein
VVGEALVIDPVFWEALLVSGDQAQGEDRVRRARLRHAATQVWLLNVTQVLRNAALFPEHRP